MTARRDTGDPPPADLGPLWGSRLLSRWESELERLGLSAEPASARPARKLGGDVRRVRADSLPVHRVSS